MKSYKRSNKCEVVYITISLNLLDEEQRKDVEYLNSFPNRAGRIRECVRAMRIGSSQRFTLFEVTEPADISLDSLEEVSELDALALLTR